MAAILKALVFLIDLAFSIYILLLMLRFLLQWARVGFNQPVSQFLFMVTNPPLRYLHKFVPKWRNADLATILLALSLQICKNFLIIGLLPGPGISLIGLIILSVADLLSLLLYIFTFSILIQVILSWVNPGAYNNPLSNFLYCLNEPLLKPARQRIPPVQGMDFSPMAVIIILQLLIILVAEPLIVFAKGL
ncbi:MAG: YggT family protein [Gammaproteobacteria bacterium]|nr:YggT family protein [Gammaproteobacteria bacterium]